jgi:hypothetical protein
LLTSADFFMIICFSFYFVAEAPGGGKSRKRTAAGGRPRALGNAGGAAGSVHGLSLRVDTLSNLSPMRSVK